MYLHVVYGRSSLGETRLLSRRRQLLAVCCLSLISHQFLCTLLPPSSRRVLAARGLVLYVFLVVVERVRLSILASVAARLRSASHYSSQWMMLLLLLLAVTWFQVPVTEVCLSSRRDGHDRLRGARQAVSGWTLSTSGRLY